ncbi:MAG: sporulation transcription factor Spo0A [Clostridia bacterium]
MKTKIFIANPTVDKLADALKEQFEIVGHTNDGIKVLEQIGNSNAEVLILDVLMPGFDGFSIQSELKNIPNSPKVVFISSLTSPEFENKAFSQGAFAYLKRNASIEEIINAVNMAASGKKQKCNSTPAMDEKISNIFISVGIPAHIKGYQFLREAVKLLISNPEVINAITKRLYPEVAERFATSASKVERAIRHAIEVAWNRGKIENINEIFNLNIYDKNEKPTNGEFIALIADKLYLEEKTELAR